jgi:hypothetical protein
MIENGLMPKYLGIDRKQIEEGIFIGQGSFSRKILTRFRMNNCKFVSTLIECGINLSKHEEAAKGDSTIFRSLV